MHSKSLYLHITYTRGHKFIMIIVITLIDIGVGGAGWTHLILRIYFPYTLDVKYADIQHKISTGNLKH